jgi:hypothetical protein
MPKGFLRITIDRAIEALTAVQKIRLAPQNHPVLRVDGEGNLTDSAKRRLPARALNLTVLVSIRRRIVGR